MTGFRVHPIVCFRDIFVEILMMNFIYRALNYIIRKVHPYLPHAMPSKYKNITILALFSTATPKPKGFATITKTFDCFRLANSANLSSTLFSTESVSTWLSYPLH